MNNLLPHRFLTARSPYAKGCVGQALLREITATIMWTLAKSNTSLLMFLLSPASGIHAQRYKQGVG